MNTSIFRLSDVLQLFSLEFVIAGTIATYLFLPGLVTTTMIAEQLLFYVISLFFLVTVVRILGSSAKKDHSGWARYIPYMLLNTLFGIVVYQFTEVIDVLQLVAYLLPIVIASNFFAWRLLNGSAREKNVTAMAVVVKFLALLYATDTSVFSILMENYTSGHTVAIFESTKEDFQYLFLVFLLLGVLDSILIWATRWFQVQAGETSGEMV